MPQLSPVGSCDRSSRPPERGGPGYWVSAALAKQAVYERRGDDGLHRAPAQVHLPAAARVRTSPAGYAKPAARLRRLAIVSFRHDWIAFVACDAVRDAGERKTDTVARLEGDADIWVATASAGPGSSSCRCRLRGTALTSSSRPPRTRPPPGTPRPAVRCASRSAPAATSRSSKRGGRGCAVFRGPGPDRAVLRRTDWVGSTA